MSEKEKLMELDELVKEAIDRVIFYFENLPEAKSYKLKYYDVSGIVDYLRIIFNRIQFGLDLNYQNASAYCDVNNIKVTNDFYSCTKERKIFILIHELCHVISYNNSVDLGIIDKFYGGATYIDSYRIVEEGLADILSELIMNYYYDNNSDENRIEEYRGEPENIGYFHEREVIKTILFFLQVNDEDKYRILDYYFGYKSSFMNAIINLGGNDVLELIRNETETYCKEGNRFVYENDIVGKEVFKNLLDKFNELMNEKDISSGVNKSTRYENVYMKENNLLVCLRFSFFLKKLLEVRGYNVDDVTIDVINGLYNDSNGLVEKISRLGFVPLELDRLICSWIWNSNEENFEEIYKIIPNVNELSNHKYFALRLEKKLRHKVDLNRLSKNDIDVIIERLNVDIYDRDIFFHEIEEVGFIEGFYIDCFENSYMNRLLFSIVNSASLEQCSKIKILKFINPSSSIMEAYFDKWLVEVFGNEFDYASMTEEKLRYVCSKSNGFIGEMMKLGVFSLSIIQMIIAWIECATNDNIYLIEELIPNVFSLYNGVFLKDACALNKISLVEYKKRAK